METSKDIKGQGAIHAFFGINMSKNENPSKQNDILVVVKVTLIYFTFWLVGPFTACFIWCEVPHCVEDRNAISKCIALDRLVMEMGCCLLDIYPYPFFFIFKYLLCHKWRKVITMYGISYHQNETQSLCKSLLLLCFLFLFCFWFCFNFCQFLYKLWDWKFACAWKKKHFHISRILIYPSINYF